MESINQRINKIVLEYCDGNNSKFAKKVGTSEANIRNYRNNTQPKPALIRKICIVFGISYSWLMDGVSSMTSPDIMRKPTAAYKAPRNGRRDTRNNEPTNDESSLEILIKNNHKLLEINALLAKATQEALQATQEMMRRLGDLLGEHGRKK
ncbi:MAG: helix-turn-helix domain-containing protein [Prevotellaceae bacterium]|jgi:transcriptional regulator with XRE-family HTH domain|nr:helix-turn-helix domain-containing protein [Prevotellaceae bacterium]